MENELKTASYQMSRTDLRRMRARALTARFLDLVDPYLADDARRDDLAHALEKLFREEGVEIVTDHDRAAMRLPPRDGLGWTADELLALEKRRLDLMFQPVTVTVPSARRS